MAASKARKRPLVYAPLIRLFFYWAAGVVVTLIAAWSTEMWSGSEFGGGHDYYADGYYMVTASGFGWDTIHVATARRDSELISLLDLPRESKLGAGSHFGEYFGWATRVSRGWPFRAFYGWVTCDAQASDRPVHVEWSGFLFLEHPNNNNSRFPFLPHWLGLAGNTVFYAVVWWCFFLVSA